MLVSSRRGEPEPRSGGHESEKPERHAEAWGHKAAEGHAGDDPARGLADRARQCDTTQEYPSHKGSQHGAHDGPKAGAKDETHLPIAGQATCEFHEKRQRAKDGAAKRAEEA